MPVEVAGPVRRARRARRGRMPDRASDPHGSPTQPHPDLVVLIEGWRRGRRWSARATHLELARGGYVASVATVSCCLVQLGINRRTNIELDGSTHRTPGRIVARHPGRMVHLDVKKVGRIPERSSQPTACTPWSGWSPTTAPATRPPAHPRAHHARRSTDSSPGSTDREAVSPSGQ